MLKELLDTLNPGRLLPKAFEKCGLCLIDKNKVIERIPSIQQSQEVASNLNTAVLKKLEVRWFGDKKAKKKPRGQKVPAGQSYSRLEEEEVDEFTSDQEDQEEETDPEEEEKDQD
jgi:hypothetical protein